MTKLKSFSIIGGGKKEDRQQNDFYPSPIEVTTSLMDFLKLTPSKILEPCCGNGAMSKVMESYGHNVTSWDIRNEESVYGIKGIDFLKQPTPTPFPYDAVITNPPFNLAEQIIRQSLKYAPTVAMVLKSQYWHAKKRVSLFNDHKPAYILPMTWRPDFMGGGSPTMDCIWTVWIENNNKAEYFPLEKPSISDQTKLF